MILYCSRTIEKPITAKARDHNLDLVKWLAFISMFIDHMRHVIPHSADTFFLTLGRLAFPLFCLMIASHLVRDKRILEPKHLISYAAQLGFFALISEIPMRLLDPASSTLNVLPTLLLGLLLAASVQVHRYAPALLIGGLALLLNDFLMYGLIGVLLPLVLMLSLQWRQQSVPFYRYLPLLLLFSGLATAQYYLPLLKLHVMPWSSIPVIGSAAIAPLIGLRLLQIPLRFHIPPLGKWAYWIYPVHFVVLYGLHLLLK